MLKALPSHFIYLPKRFSGPGTSWALVTGRREREILPLVITGLKIQKHSMCNQPLGESLPLSRLSKIQLIDLSLFTAYFKRKCQNNLSLGFNCIHWAVCWTVILLLFVHRNVFILDTNYFTEEAVPQGSAAWRAYPGGQVQGGGGEHWLHRLCQVSFFSFHPTSWTIILTLTRCPTMQMKIKSQQLLQIRIAVYLNTFVLQVPGRSNRESLR